MNRTLRALSLAVVLAVAIGGSGCTIAKISGSGPRPLLLNNPTWQFDVVRHFKIEKSITFDYTSSFEIDGVVAEVLAATGADAVINMRFSVKVTPANFCLNSVTCGLAQAKTLSVEGDAIKFRQ